MRLLAIYFSIAFIHAIMLFVSSTGSSNNMPFYHLITPIELTFFSLLYYYKIKNKKVRRLLPLMVVIFCLFSILDATYIEGLFSFNIYPRALQGIIMVSLSLLYFQELINSEVLIPLEKQSMFWINSGVLIYFAITFFLYALEYYNSNTENFQPWMFISFVSVISNILYAIGMAIGIDIRVPIRNKQFN